MTFPRRLAAFVVVVGFGGRLAGAQDLDHGAVATDATLTKGCGADCLVYTMHRLGRSDMTRAAAERRVDPDGDGLCSIADLMGAYTDFDVRASALHSDEKVLPAGLAVLLVRTTHGRQRPSHFVVLEATREERKGERPVFVPYLGLSRMDEARLTDLWDGDFIAIGESKGTGVASMLIAWLAPLLVGAGAGAWLGLMRRRR